MVQESSLCLTVSPSAERAVNCLMELSPTPSAYSHISRWTNHNGCGRGAFRGRSSAVAGVWWLSPASRCFNDEHEADFGDAGGRAATVTPNLERDLEMSPRIRDLVRSDLFATLLYGAMCNTVWRHVATGTLCYCTRRHAGNVVAMLRCEGDYMDWVLLDGRRPGGRAGYGRTGGARLGACRSPAPRRVGERCRRTGRQALAAANRQWEVMSLWAVASFCWSLPLPRQRSLLHDREALGCVYTDAD